MPTLKFQAVKMSDAKVSHISLVERGANRIPFRVIKQEKQGMSKGFGNIDLGNLFTRKAEKPQPEIVGIVALKGETLESVQKQIADAGYDVAHAIEAEDGSVIFKQGEGEVTGEGVVVRLSEHIAVVTKGFSPYNMDITSDGVTFADLCQAQGFYPGINTIMDVLGNSVRTTVYASETPADAKAQVAKLMSEASNYLSTFLSGLPVKAFKMEEIAPVIAAKEEPAAKDETPASTEEGAAAGEPVEKAAKKPGEVCDDESMTDEDKAAKAKAKKDEEDAEQARKDAEAAATKKAEDEAALAVKPLTEAEVSAIVASHVSKSMEGVTGTLQTMTDALAQVSKSMQEFGTRTEKAEQAAADAVQRIAGVVVTGSDGGDAEPVARKSESGVGRDFDTAYQPRRPFPSR